MKYGPSNDEGDDASRLFDDGGGRERVDGGDSDSDDERERVPVRWACRHPGAGR